MHGGTGMKPTLQTDTVMVWPMIFSWLGQISDGLTISIQETPRQWKLISETHFHTALNTDQKAMQLEYS